MTTKRKATDEHSDEPTGDTAQDPAAPVTGYRIAREDGEPVRAGGYVLTDRGWQLDTTESG